MRMSLRSIAVSSVLLLAALAAAAATRPHYGGLLRVELRSPVRSLDPRDDASARVTPLLFDTLVTLDEAGRPQQSLAVSWVQESDRRWWFTLRTGVTFSNGTPMTAAAAAESLRAVHADWNVRDAGNVVIIETDQPATDLPAVLSLPANSITLRDGNNVFGTGAFTVGDFQPGSKLTLSARDDGWRARPFVDRIEFQFSRGLRDQAADLDSGRADVVELSPEEGPRAGSGRRIVRSDPSVLYVLRFSHTNAPTRDARVRAALSLAIDREGIANFLLQRHGEAVAGLLPNWLTGYAFLFPTQRRLDRARQLRAESRASLPMALVYHSGDPVARLIAERVALNAADAGLTVRPTPDTQNIAVPDIELLELPLPSLDPAIAAPILAQTGALGLPFPPPVSDSPEDVYRSTAAALKENWAVPIAYAPATFGLGARVSNWTISPSGQWRLEGVSLPPEGAKP
jgi:peptide/nickel transport system substrate-binding protein